VLQAALTTFAPLRGNPRFERLIAGGESSVRFAFAVAGKHGTGLGDFQLRQSPTFE
jgi:hypothetical protein